MNYLLYIFDLDGTLADTSLGIIHSCNEAAKIVNGNVLSESDLIQKIGSPVSEIFKTCYNFDGETSLRAIAEFRKIYDMIGIHSASIYPGIDILLNELKLLGSINAVVTMKPRDSAERMISELGIKKYIDIVYGKGDNPDITKKHMIEQCLNKYNVSKKKTVVIGDSTYDQQGAQEADVDFIGVTYGYGFHDDKVLIGSYHKFCAKSVAELKNILLQSDQYPI